MSYMAALMLVQEPVEAIAYATLVTLLQVHTVQSARAVCIRRACAVKYCSSLASSYGL